MTVPLHFAQQAIQIHQLNAINWQLQQQQQAAAWQANLSQALHDTEKMAYRVSSTRMVDMFSAAVLARDWLLRVSGLGPASFTDIHSKRSWSEAYGCLDGVARAAANDSRLGQQVDAYLALMDRLSAYRQRLGGEPTVVLERLRRAYQATSDGDGLRMAAAVTTVLAMPALAVESARALGVLLVIMAAVMWGVWNEARNTRAKALTMLNAGERFVAEYERFLADPEGGAWLQNKWAFHRCLFEAPVPDGPPSSSVTSSQTYVERKVVERQVVVTRCKFCSQLSPVDLPTCEHCGAPGFGSSQ